MEYGKILKLGVTEFRRFSDFVLANNKKLTPHVFSSEYSKVKRGFLAGNTRDQFCSEAEQFATRLAEQKSNDFAGIVYSDLCKLSEFTPKALEKYAFQGYEAARANGDYIHMMARLNDLRKIYMHRPEKLYDYIQVLYKQEKCLKQLARHYDSAVDTFQSVSRKPAKKEDYEQMLAYVQTEIGKLTKKKHPNDAHRKLLSARDIFEHYQNVPSIKYIDMLLKEIEKAQKQVNK